jgi:O-antigen ligase/tetratricopeptide (TPR) repeat protein
MTARARGVLWTLQATIVALPLFLGGRQPFGLLAAWTAMAVLLVLTLRARRSVSRPVVPGAAALAAFVALGLFTALPLPPWLIERIAPATAQLYRDVLPGWPDAGGWSSWRSLALDPYAVHTTLSTLAVGFGVYLVLVGYPWGDEDARARAFGRVFLAALGGGVALALLALFQEVAGNGHVLWITDETAASGRVSGPFVNPNHLACWLEMIIPAAAAYAWALAGLLRRRIAKAVESGQRLGLRPRRAWVGALIANQRRLAIPFLAVAGVALMATALVGTQSRGGLGALLVGLGVAFPGILARASKRRHRRVSRWIPAAALALLVGAGVVALGLWARTEGPEVGGVDQVDVSFASRLAVALQGTAIVRDHPLFGTGLGSWLHAFRGYVSPPVEGGIWDHAHDEYLELAAETGVLGMALAACFALAVVVAIRRARRRSALADARRERRDRSLSDPPEWRTALGEHGVLSWGLAGGVVAILVHSLVEFGLHMPGNLVLLMAAVALLVLALPPREGRTSFGLAAFTALGFAAAAPIAWNTALTVTGRAPLSPDDALAAADRAFSEDGDAARAQELARAAIDRSPAYRDAHEMLANVLGAGPQGEDALRRALRLEPWYAPGRDDLAFRLWRRGAQDAAVAALEESFYRLPSLISHAFLGPDAELTPDQGPYVVRALADGDVVGVRLAILDQPLTAAIERGLDRALGERQAGEERAGIIADLVLLLESNQRWTEAADTLRAEARRDERDDESLGHAARNYLKANDPARAEEALLAALLRNPERGSLYQRLAVDIYAPRGDFALAEKTLEAGERNAVDMLPIYAASADVIAKREQAWTEKTALGAGGSR